MQTGTVRVLLVEDDPDHAQMIRRRLGKICPHPPEVTWVDCLEGAVRACPPSFDVILLDLKLPDSGLSETVSRMSRYSPGVPIIALTSIEELELALNMLKQGAQDYLVKSDATTEILSRSIAYAIERERIQRDLRYYTAELERKNRELDQFTRTVSHDLKSPLSVISMDLYALLKTLQESDSAHVARVKRLYDTTGSMARLIDDLLKFARAGAENLSLEQVNCDDLLSSIISELQPMIDSSGGRVSVDTMPSIWANREHLQELFRELIVNSLKYHGDRPPEVYVSAEYLSDGWVFSVEDRGIGIPKQEHLHVFDMFKRLNAAEVDGTGVGLAICKQVVEAHHGRIWVDSEEGQGTAFYFTLSVKPPLPVPEVKTRDGVTSDHAASR
jgi:signal transduction histidine kinase